MSRELQKSGPRNQKGGKEWIQCQSIEKEIRTKRKKKKHKSRKESQGGVPAEASRRRMDERRTRLKDRLLMGKGEYYSGVAVLDPLKSEGLYQLGTWKGRGLWAKASQRERNMRVLGKGSKQYQQGDFRE